MRRFITPFGEFSLLYGTFTALLADFQRLYSTGQWYCQHCKAVVSTGGLSNTSCITSVRISYHETTRTNKVRGEPRWNLFGLLLTRSVCVELTKKDYPIYPDNHSV